MLDEGQIQHASEQLQVMSKMLAESERQFLQFNEIVPYASNSGDVYSPRLVDMLQSVGAQIDGTFKILINISELKVEREHFPEFFKQINQQGLLSVQELLLREDARLLAPFKFDATLAVPLWWSAYNQVKHELPNGAFSGKYGNVINALAALSTLHGLVKFAIASRGLRKEILNSKNWGSFIDYWNLRSLSQEARKKFLRSDLIGKQSWFESTVFYSPMSYSPKE